MKKRLLFLLLLSISLANAQNSPINLIPIPFEMQQSAGSYTLSKATTVSFNKPDGRKIADMLTQKLNTSTGFSLAAQQGKLGMIQLNLNDAPNAQIGNEGYMLEATTKGVIITANQVGGLFYGMQTLVQLLPKEIESKTVATAKLN